MSKIVTETYYQKLKCYSYYRDGNRIVVGEGIELIMTGFISAGIKCICEDTFNEGDVAILNIHVDGYPYEKLMCNIVSAHTFGEMKELDMEIMGMPNRLHDKIHQAEMACEARDHLELSQDEKALLKSILLKLER